MRRQDVLTARFIQFKTTETMRMKKILFAALLAMTGMAATAQETVTVEEFHHHWFVQGQVGAQYTTGETTFGKLLSPNAQLAVGYQFTPVWGLRLAANGWQSRGGSEILGDVYTWKWNYAAPKLDVMFDLTNAFGGFKANRVVSFGIFAGLGANIAFGNDEAADVKQQIMSSYFPTGYQGAEAMSYLWDGTKPRLLGNVGVNLDFRVSKRVKVGLEVAYNAVTDHYNSKNAPGKCDHYYNALAGVRVDLGKLTSTRQVPSPVVYKEVEKIIQKTVHDTTYVDRMVEREELRRDIFFLIRGSVISDEEMHKVDEVVAYMQKYPRATVTVTGYADKGTGNAKLNVGYAQKRADVVAETLKQRGVPANRIIVDAKGDTEQPYAENDKNRVTICIAQ